MDAISTDYTGSLFVSTYNQQSLDSLANTALTNGIDLYMREDYKGAVKEFQRSIGLSPESENSVDAANYMAMAYLQLGDTENAIKAYEKSVTLNPYLDDTRITLGNLYFSEERYDEAATSYKEAVRLNPDASNCFSLGQAYIYSGQYDLAENQFNTVRRLEPTRPNGNYGLGLVYSKQERYEDAIREFKEAISLNEDFYGAYAELGYAYADLGMIDEAREQKEFLEQNDYDLSETLSKYIFKVDPPKFVMAYSTDFIYSKSTNTLVSSLDTYLQNANTSKTFHMEFLFDKSMDRETVENRFNWTIKRSSGTEPGEAYNFGLPVPSTEIKISTYPDSVYYDSESLKATIKFTIAQNASADGTIDPSHIVFNFNGKDQYGYKMDIDYDEFSGFSGTA